MPNEHPLLLKDLLKRKPLAEWSWRDVDRNEERPHIPWRVYYLMQKEFYSVFAIAARLDGKCDWKEDSLVLDWMEMSACFDGPRSLRVGDHYHHPAAGALDYPAGIIQVLKVFNTLCDEVHCEMICGKL